MSTLVGRMAGAVSDLTIGTVIVLFHVALAVRVANRERILPTGRVSSRDAWSRLHRDGDAVLEEYVHELP
jgi:hypothetical protein